MNTGLLAEAEPALFRGSLSGAASRLPLHTDCAPTGGAISTVYWLKFARAAACDQATFIVAILSLPNAQKNRGSLLAGARTLWFGCLDLAGLRSLASRDPQPY